MYNNFQSGFRKGHSCHTAILNVVENIRTNMRRNLYTIVVLLDFKSAFPSIDHQILRKILKSYNINENAQKWYDSYLENRHQYIKLNGIQTKFEKLEKGVCH